MAAPLILSHASARVCDCSHSGMLVFFPWHLLSFPLSLFVHRVLPSRLCHSGPALPAPRAARLPAAIGHAVCSHPSPIVAFLSGLRTSVPIQPTHHFAPVAQSVFWHLRSVLADMALLAPSFSAPCRSSSTFGYPFTSASVSSRLFGWLSTGLLPAFFQPSLLRFKFFRSPFLLGSSVDPVPRRLFFCRFSLSVLRSPSACVSLSSHWARG